jgi:hypothetical protein
MAASELAGGLEPAEREALMRKHGVREQARRPGAPTELTERDLRHSARNGVGIARVRLAQGAVQRAALRRVRPALRPRERCPGCATRTRRSRTASSRGDPAPSDCDEPPGGVAGRRPTGAAP